MPQPPQSGRPSPPVERSGTLIENDPNLAERLRAPQGHGERSGTLLETDEDLRQALNSGLAGQPAAKPASPPQVGRPAAPFRPTVRTPVALLTVYDDGREEGEVIRLRDARFVVGRSEGDLLIPHDGRISSRHVEITRQHVGGVHRWVVTDLQSTNGLFVRVRKTPLADKAEFLVGSGRYRFDSPQSAANETADFTPPTPNHAQTVGWDAGPSPFRPPALTEMVGSEIGNRIILTKPEYWIGTEPACQICRGDDPFCEPRHLRIYRGPKGDWLAEHNKTLNGLWLRMPQIVVDAAIQFQIGEQRFRLKV